MKTTNIIGLISTLSVGALSDVFASMTAPPIVVMGSDNVA